MCHSVRIDKQPIFASLLQMASCASDGFAPFKEELLTHDPKHPLHNPVVFCHGMLGLL